MNVLFFRLTLVSSFFLMSCANANVRAKHTDKNNLAFPLVTGSTLRDRHSHRPQDLASHGHKVIEAVHTASALEHVLQRASHLFSSNKNGYGRVTVVDENEHRRRAKKAKKSHNNDSCKQELESCQALQTVSSFLFVQMANQCQLLRSLEGDYSLALMDVHHETWAFSDRPMRTEGVTSTVEFLNNFNTLLFPDDPPNGAMTFVHESDNTFNGPLVAIMVGEGAPVTDDSTGAITFSYQLSQSLDQASIISLDSFFDSPSGEATSPLYMDCSMFIDTCFQQTGGNPNACMTELPCYYLGGSSACNSN